MSKSAIRLGLAAYRPFRKSSPKLCRATKSRQLRAGCTHAKGLGEQCLWAFDKQWTGLLDRTSGKVSMKGRFLWAFDKHHSPLKCAPCMHHSPSHAVACTHMSHKGAPMCPCAPLRLTRVPFGKIIPSMYSASAWGSSRKPWSDEGVHNHNYCSERVQLGTDIMVTPGARPHV